MGLTGRREGIETGRSDVFVDGAFAFILTLLLIGGESVPGSTGKLLALGGIPAFAACFFQIVFFWHGHVRWRRRRRVADAADLDARREMRVWIVPAAIGVASALTALLMSLSAPGWMWSIPGFMYVLLFLIGPVVNRFNRHDGVA